MDKSMVDIIDMLDDMSNSLMEKHKETIPEKFKRKINKIASKVEQNRKNLGVDTTFEMMDKAKLNQENTKIIGKASIDVAIKRSKGPGHIKLIKEKFKCLINSGVKIDNIDFIMEELDGAIELNKYIKEKIKTND